MTDNPTKAEVDAALNTAWSREMGRLNAWLREQAAEDSMDARNDLTELREAGAEWYAQTLRFYANTMTLLLEGHVPYQPTPRDRAGCSSCGARVTYPCKTVLTISGLYQDRLGWEPNWVLGA